MCGRYRLSRRKQMIEEYFETEDEVDWEPRYNIAPSQPVGIIRQDPSKPERHFSLARWGLIPSWATDASIGFKTINARAETVADKPAFRDAFVSRRCMVPAGRVFRMGSPASDSRPSMPARKRSRINQHSVKPSLAVGAYFLRTVFSNGRDEEKKSSPSTSACWTIPCLPLPVCGIAGKIRVAQ